MDVSDKKEIIKKSEDISGWYTNVILKAKFADYGPARGTMVIRPYGYAVWENIQKALDSKIKKGGVRNAYFPLFFPYSLLKQEKEHVEGFSPELALITHGGGEKLAEPLVVRPTSETVMYSMYSKWIKSWKDLPMVMNQWNNVVRWEKRTLIFLRTSEFLWQEGHGAHATNEESKKMVQDALNWYREMFEDYLAVAVITGIKSESEKFAGAYATYGAEALMPDGKALQASTSHDLGQKFSKPQDIKFQNKEGKMEYVWQNSWGFSTRTIGGMIMVHGDDDGLAIPPKLAPIKAVIIPVLGKRDDKILAYCQKVKAELEKCQSEFPGQIEVWGDQEKSYGWKVNEAEIMGIPLRISVGSRELDDKTITLASRTGSLKNKMLKLSDCGDIEVLLTGIQKEMFDKSQKSLAENTHVAGSYDEFKNIMKTTRGFIKAYWCQGKDCETKIKEETKATTRVRESENDKGKCIYCGKDTGQIWYFAQAY